MTATDDLQNKVVVVTGAAGGIGQATARLLASEGMVVVLLDMAPTGEFVAQAIRDEGNNALYVQTDIADEASVQAAFQTIQEQFDSLDALINVAGINRKYRITEMPVAEWDVMMAVNVRGMFLTIKHGAPLMRASGGGAIVNMSSVSAFIGTTGYIAYHTTKGAILSLSRGAAQELAPDNIRVNTICPGWVDTSFTDAGLALVHDPEAVLAQANNMHMLGRIAKPEEIADAALFLISKRASFITAESLFVDGGFIAKR
jgi:NAD(P)-dependent dehydrogenase (short-subunit alcohol dehydrogenase family)